MLLTYNLISREKMVKYICPFLKFKKKRLIIIPKNVLFDIFMISKKSYFMVK